MEHVMIFPVLSPIAKHANPSSVLGVIGCYCSPLTVSAQVLCRIKAKACDVAKASHWTPLVPASMGLCRIFDDNEIVAFCHFQNRVHVRRLPVQMHWQDGLGT